MDRTSLLGALCLLVAGCGGTDEGFLPLFVGEDETCVEVELTARDELDRENGPLLMVETRGNDRLFGKSVQTYETLGQALDQLGVDPLRLSLGCASSRGIETLRAQAWIDRDRSSIEACEAFAEAPGAFGQSLADVGDCRPDPDEAQGLEVLAISQGFNRVVVDIQ